MSNKTKVIVKLKFFLMELKFFISTVIWIINLVEWKDSWIIIKNRLGLNKQYICSWQVN